MSIPACLREKRRELKWELEKGMVASASYGMSPTTAIRLYCAGTRAGTSWYCTFAGTVPSKVSRLSCISVLLVCFEFLFGREVVSGLDVPLIVLTLGSEDGFDVAGKGEDNFDALLGVVDANAYGTNVHWEGSLSSRIRKKLGWRSAPLLKRLRPMHSMTRPRILGHSAQNLMRSSSVKPPPTS